MVSTAAPAAAATTVVLRQHPVSFGMMTRHDAGAAYHRITLGTFAETLQLGSDRNVVLQANADVPATLESGHDATPVRLVLSAAKGRSSAASAVSLARTIEVRSSDAHARLLARMDLDLELDLLGLGEEAPHVRIRSAKITGLEGLGAPFSGHRLTSRPLLAAPAAPLDLPVVGTEVVVDEAQSAVHGTLTLDSPMSPAAFQGEAGAQLVVTVYRGADQERIELPVSVDRKNAFERWDGAAQGAVRKASVEWRKLGSRWNGIVHVELPKLAGVDRVSLRFGDPSSPSILQAVGLAARDVKLASASLPGAPAVRLAP